MNQSPQDLILFNVKMFTPSGLREGGLRIRDGKIVDLGQNILPENVPIQAWDSWDGQPTQGPLALDGGGLYLSPGFIDLHVHGGGGCSASSDKPEDIVAMVNAHARFGTTSILPTTSSAPFERIRKAVAAIHAASSMACNANIAGVHLEGPYLSPEQSGAQAPDALVIPAEKDATPLLEVWPEGIKIMGVAPELPGALALGERLAAQGIVASIAHSNATYVQIQEALEHGYTDVTHLYSGCSGMIRINSYRISGVIEAGLNLDALTAQVIADGKHLPMELLQLIYRCKGPENILLITDGLKYSAAELQEGTSYRQSSGMELIYEDGVMKLANRQAFAGSVATMNRLIRNMRTAGVPLAHAVRMATENPAKRINLSQKGRLGAGFDADLVLFDEDIEVQGVLYGGKKMPHGKA